MNNEEIIKKRWEDIDKQLNKFSGKFKYDIKARIQAIIRTFDIKRDNLYDYMKTNDLTMLKTELQDNVDKDMGDLLKLKTDRMLNRTKVKYYEALELLINLAYYKMMKKTKQFEDELFNETAIITSKIVQKQSYEVRKPRFKKYHLIPLPNYLLPHIMSLPLYLGYDWLSYKENMINYNANKTYRNIVIGIQQSSLDLDKYDKSFNIERKRYLTALDNEIASISSYVSIWGMEKQGIKKVQYVAVMDEKTTHICESMNGQIFNVNDWNTYYRLANDNDEKLTKYVTKGLQIGENQPALHYNCRSVLIPYM